VSIDPNSAVPVYQQIGDYIRRSVAAGVYRPGELIPSLRALALQLTVNPNTYEELEREGLIQARKGLGMMVTNNGAAGAQRRSEAAVYDSFAHGIRAGAAAAIPPDRVRATFEKAWQDVGAEATDKP
jgi:GntR family transcriptional regulator